MARRLSSSRSRACPCRAGIRPAPRTRRPRRPGAAPSPRTSPPGSSISTVLSLTGRMSGVIKIAWSSANWLCFQISPSGPVQRIQTQASRAVPRRSALQHDRRGRAAFVGLRLGAQAEGRAHRARDAERERDPARRAAARISPAPSPRSSRPRRPSAAPRRSPWRCASPAPPPRRRRKARAARRAGRAPPVQKAGANRPMTSAAGPIAAATRMVRRVG